MVNQAEMAHQEIIQSLIKYAFKKLPKKKAELFEKFIPRYYASSSAKDLAERSIDNLFGALVSHWNFIYERKPGDTKIRVFNPDFKQEGWESTHTIVQISHDDIPFLVDSIRLEINRCGYQIHFMIHLGGLHVQRDAKNQIIDILPMDHRGNNYSTEAPIYIEIDRQTDEKVMAELQTNIERVLDDVRLAVVDWRKMVGQVQQALQELEQSQPALDMAEITESKDFLRWLIDDNFTFLGCRDYTLVGKGSNKALQLIPGSGLGVLRDDSSSKVSRSYAELPPQARKLALSPHILIIAKTNTKSSVHRDAYTDYIGVKRFNEKGALIGERRFVGLYTSTAYHMSPRYIPFLRLKVAKVIDKFKFPSASHNGKELIHILETLPRDDLFQATYDDLVALARGILQLQERKQIRLFVRKDTYDRYFSCLVYLPRDIFNTELCLAMQEILLDSFQGEESTFTTLFSASVLVQVHFLIRVNPKHIVEYDVNQIEQQLIAVGRSWIDEFKENLINHFGEALGLKYFAKYAKAVPVSYMEYYLPQTAMGHIELIETLTAENPLAILFYQPSKAEPNALRLKLFNSKHTIPLSDVLPMLENMGLRIIGEMPHELVFKDRSIVWLNDFDMTYVGNTPLDVSAIKEIFQDAFSKIWFHLAENDGFNRLVLEAQLTWQETAMLRAYTKYLRQTGFMFSQDYVEKALVNNPSIAKSLVELFTLRFLPDADDKRTDVGVVVTKIEKSFDAVNSLDEDRILRRILEVISATLRTNYFQIGANNKPKSYISFKFDPAQISDLPLPRPMFEIFVYSPRVEAVHLRGGKVARGGIRWSDRREDFRTEVLGLMKAQQVKNAVIVPVGAKGGFYPKQLPSTGSRDELMTEVIYCYSIFMRGLLDITDNLKNNKVVHPINVVRYDEDDTYLVVAADKGTATFSDIANSIAHEYGFWLGDAFASGGSVGYDHKKMGITARGAWESVKRHFRELGKDVDNEEITVVGVGDLSGDVFGNGMLRSRHLKLIAAYNHLHIFLDPNPNPEKSYLERERIFNLPRSTWDDYDKKLISKGGGVFSRAAKSIKLSPEIKRALNIKKDTLIPTELIRAMLTAPVDLIWNGGIGTFVKASTESNADVGDRANDSIRVDGSELMAHVIGEGGNLGMTQLGRVEYALNGGLLYTDFIDNSAGVGCSDQEVNIKILLNNIVASGEMTVAQRNKLLEKMTDEVAKVVLRGNYKQTQVLSLEAGVATRTIDLFSRLITELEKNGQLNRKLEFLPDEKAIQERKALNQGLTRPELAILLSYGKAVLKQAILATDIPEHPYFNRYLTSAFPVLLQKSYAAQMQQHSLRREIITTQLTNTITDHMGINFVERLQHETGAPVAFIIRAYAIAETLFSREELWQQVEALDNKVKFTVQGKMMLQIYYLVRRATRWILRNHSYNVDIDATIKDYLSPIKTMQQQLPQLLSSTDEALRENVIRDFTAEGVPEVLASRIADCNIMFTSLDIIAAAKKYNFSINDVAKTYFSLGDRLALDWLREQMNSYVVEDQWDELARSGFRDDLDRVQRELSIAVLSLKTKTKDIIQRLDTWLSQHSFLMERWQALITEIKSSDRVGFVMYSVVLRELFDYAHVGK